MACLDSSATGLHLNDVGDRVSSPDMLRLRVRARGLVQGVGFRPHVFRLAQECRLTGWVRNDGEGVILEVQGDLAQEFVRRLESELPPLARLDSLSCEKTQAIDGEKGFSIVASETTAVSTSIVPDAATCADCLRESRTPTDRRCGYPFLNCTHCGPRYTITRRLPYDRRQTSMSRFPMCPACHAEYEDPLDRRFHAQPTACPLCGPQLSHPIAEVAQMLLDGKIVALKGLGGFHLVCDAGNEAAVALLRRRKNRDAKPFAVMVADIHEAEHLVEMCASARKLLSGSEKPIVLLPRRGEGMLAPSVAPGMSTLGIMVPYTPLHHLLFDALGRMASKSPAPALVMTSANPGGEPLVISNEEAASRLNAIADVIVTHDRDILVRVDDSVVGLTDGAPLFIRRARGYVPRAISLPHALPCTVALGADLKNTIAVTRGNEAFLSQHVGDLDNLETVDFLKEVVHHLLTILDVRPERVVCDLHPDFASTRVAEELAREWGVPLFHVQHHAAHVASVIVEQKWNGSVLGVALDGYGLGDDGGSWGGELLLAQDSRIKRVGRLAHLMQPGGDVAAREPWRMGAAALFAMGRSNEISKIYADVSGSDIVAQMLARGLNSPPTSSMGRWFDAACGLLRLRDVAAFEGQAPMELEGLCRLPQPISEGHTIVREGELDVLSLLPSLETILSLTSDHRAASERFHGAVVAGISAWVIGAARRYGVTDIALSGGCFLNRILAQGVLRQLREAGLNPQLPRQVPPNDGCIALGQVWWAALHRDS